MTNQQLIDVIQKGVKAWNCWREKNPTVEIDLRGVNLRGLDLSGINFKNANLEKAKLRKTNLSQANLSYANLIDAKLNRATLIEADFYGSQLTSADLNRSILMGADFRRTDLLNVNLSDADLCEVNFTGASFRGVDLRRANLSQGILSGCKLIGVYLNHANLSKAHLSGTTFKSSHLNDANFIGATLSGVSFDDTIILNTKFGLNVGLTDVTQDGLEKRGAIFDAKNHPEALNYSHFLVLEDKLGQRLIHLRALKYSIGRDLKASIRLFDQSVSRFHAMVYRLSNLNNTVAYHLVDGDSNGKASTNGIKVNQRIYQSKTLESGDVITLGNKELQYLMFEDSLTLPLQCVDESDKMVS